MKRTLFSLFLGLSLAPAVAFADEPVPLPLSPAAVDHTAMPETSLPTGLMAALTLAPIEAPSAHEAEVPEGLAQYFPQNKPVQQFEQGYSGPMVAPQVNPLRVGIAFHLGGSVPRNETMGRNADEFRGTFDLGGALHFNWMRFFSVDLAVRGGFGGLNTELYEQRYRIPTLNGRHFYAGLHGRLHPFALGPLQPFVSGAVGVDRVMAVRYEGTGSYVCSDYGTWGQCDEEMTRTFAAGYWGSSWGLGLGLLLDAGPELPFTMSFEVMRNWNHYGRYTVTNQPSILLGNLTPTVANTTYLLAFNFMLW